MRRFLVLVLIMVSVVACSNKKEEARFLRLMATTEFMNPATVSYFTDDFKSFFDGSIEYKIRSVYEYDMGFTVAEYYESNGGR